MITEPMRTSIWFVVNTACDFREEEEERHYGGTEKVI
jgi:hypothetical protein